ncbi:MAG: hypothetical protein HOA57_02670 [Candidatus Magasanikbacteria bacterium]|jgi:hypothetical protein|nr:hypothetical protein [Candidatus Magasanikbacteria bacterium]MBT4315265.1 hypothetical protein [Candidatus Magasanikbacteria bacterium]MBT4546959.1 hypothetical protein [Candidatus Magasanikbacteria bacterium]MBT6819258.1 hypothetical protein [Candidatus Magasanikbacteria bacterium]
MVNSKKISIVIVLSVLVLVVIFFVSYFIKQKKSVIDLEEQKGSQVQVGEDVGAVGIDKVYISFPKDENDLDMDGIDDEKEKELGTSNSAVDTDGDGLSDKIEIEKLGTDPTKGDTDGDGFSDASELRNGYDPLGPGKLEN